MILPTLELEQSLWEKGYKHVAGLDEVGRGPLAGPVVAGAVVINSPDQMVMGVRDSKKISLKKRNEMYSLIKEVSSGYGVGIVNSKEIDRIGIAEAVNLAMALAISNMIRDFNIKPDFLIIDGANVQDVEGYKCHKVNKGDVNHYSIAAASILAKVTRDNMMFELADKFPNYGFEKHVGYGTKQHIEAIYKYGICEIHRRSFEPIKSLL